jgi:hypothetical protein
MHYPQKRTSRPAGATLCAVWNSSNPIENNGSKYAQMTTAK